MSLSLLNTNQVVLCNHFALACSHHFSSCCTAAAKCSFLLDSSMSCVYGSSARLFSWPALVGLVREMRGVERWEISERVEVQRDCRKSWLVLLLWTTRSPHPHLCKAPPLWINLSCNSRQSLLSWYHESRLSQYHLIPLPLLALPYYGVPLVPFSRNSLWGTLALFLTFWVWAFSTPDRVSFSLSDSIW
jgi:hypothetical protein